eukprot:187918_1
MAQESKQDWYDIWRKNHTESPPKTPRNIDAERRAHRKMWATKMKAKEITPDSLYLDLTLRQKYDMLTIIYTNKPYTTSMKNSWERKDLLTLCGYEQWLEYDEEFDDVRLFEWVWESRARIEWDVHIHDLKIKKYGRK